MGQDREQIEIAFPLDRWQEEINRASGSSFTLQTSLKSGAFILKIAATPSSLGYARRKKKAQTSISEAWSP
jgi:hypothetical protein